MTYKLNDQNMFEKGVLSMPDSVSVRSKAAGAIIMITVAPNANNGLVYPLKGGSMPAQTK